MKHKNPSFLITGANFTNKGAEAMLKTVSAEIRSRYEKGDVFVVCHQNEAEIAASQGFKPLFVRTGKYEKLLNRINGKLRLMLGLPTKPYTDFVPINDISSIPNLKTVVDVSGYAYSDKGGYLQPLEALKIQDVCRAQNAAYIFMPQAWGPFSDAETASNCRKMLREIPDFYARDLVSRKHLATLLEVGENDISLKPDIAFRFSSGNTDGAAILQSCGYKNVDDLPLLGISPNMRVYERSGGAGLENTYLRLLKETIEELGKEYHLVLIPNEIRPPGALEKDDASLCNLLADHIGEEFSFTLITGYRTAEEIKAVIGRMDMLIASRFHSLIFGMSQGVPSIAVSWSHKYRELFGLFDLESFVLEHDALQSDSVIKLFRELEGKKGDVRQKLKTVVPGLQKETDSLFELL